MKKSITLFVFAFLIAIAAGQAQEMKLDAVIGAYNKATGIEKMKS